MPNRLIKESSPYLKSHAHNPVDWYAWGDEAFAKAKLENKPILLSIGYSSCHWCHVMEHESFSNPEIAAIQNEHFVSIKLDREERPDLDEIYMNAVQMLTGRGGWPLNIFLTSDLKPFYGGTYFPPEPRYNVPAWPQLLLQVARYYREHQEDVVKTTDELFRYLADKSPAKETDATISDAPVKKLVADLTEAYDASYGGFGYPPKFPHANDLTFLIEQYRRDKSPNVLKMVTHTLDRMARGGIYDQLGGGFHRYSTDERWLIPHFEKMLYDNASLLYTYANAYQVTGNAYYKSVCDEIASYIKIEMTHTSGAFFAAQDADSEGKEGTYFVWRHDEIVKLIDPEHAEFVCAAYGVTKAGNFEHGTNALWFPEDVYTVGARFNLSADQVREILHKAKEILLAERVKREKPMTDKKILASWNGLMIAGLAKAGFVEQAKASATFIFKNLMKDGELYHSHTVGLSDDGVGHEQIHGFLEDYAYVTQGLIELFLATSEPDYLIKARLVQKKTRELFLSESQAEYYFTSKHHQDVIVRSSRNHDGALPSPQGVAVFNDLMLGFLLSDDQAILGVRKILASTFEALEKMPRAFTQTVRVLDWCLNEPPLIMIVGDPTQKEFGEFVDFFKAGPEASNLVMPVDTRQKKVWDEFESVKIKLDVKVPTVFVCRGHTCAAPMTSLHEIQSARGVLF